MKPLLQSPLGLLLLLAEVTNSLQVQEKRRPISVKETVERTGFKYYCDSCGVGFKKQKNLEQHLAGKTHLQVVAERASIWERFSAAAPSWAAAAPPPPPSPPGAEKDEAEAEASMDVLTRWSVLDDLDNFPKRASGMLDPSATVASISPASRARFYRYLHDSFGKHYPELPAILHEVDASGSGRYLRVKELFESFEAFKILSSVVLTAEQQGRPVPAIWDLACGHGLVGILLAYRFPRKKVVCVDLERRPAFAAFADAWRMHGDAHGGDGSDPLANLEYREGDLKRVFDEQAAALRGGGGGGAEGDEEGDAGGGRGADERLETGNGGGDGCFPSVVGGGDFVVALHACNEANRDVVLGAQAAGAVWGE
jgi:hypothetical protein